MGQAWSKYVVSYWNPSKYERTKVLELMERPVNVLLVGLPGAGKSSLVTALFHSLNGFEAKEVAPAGLDLNGYGHTRYLKSYPCKTNNTPTDKRLDQRVTRIFDMWGLNTMEKVNAELQKILEGGIREGVVFNNVQDGTHEYAANDMNKIDRVIFVHSCQEYVPHEIAKSVFDICHQRGM